MNPVALAEKRQKIFLRYLAETGKPIEAARRAGYSNTASLQKKRREDETFAERWDNALQAAADRMEQEAVRRATDGVLEPHFYKGRVTGYTRKYSDSLLMFLLRGLRPDRYRETVNVNSNVTGRIGVAVLPMTAVSPQDWEARSGAVHEEHMKNVTPGDEPPALPAP